MEAVIESEMVPQDLPILAKIVMSKLKQQRHYVRKMHAFPETNHLHRSTLTISASKHAMKAEKDSKPPLVYVLAPTQQ